MYMNDYINFLILYTFGFSLNSTGSTIKLELSNWEKEYLGLWLLLFIVLDLVTFNDLFCPQKINIINASSDLILKKA